MKIILNCEENERHMNDESAKGFCVCPPQIYLQRPKRCPATLFNMMRQCWKRTAEERPTFQQMNTYLLEKIRSKPFIKSKPPQIKPPPLHK